MMCASVVDRSSFKVIGRSSVQGFLLGVVPYILQVIPQVIIAEDPSRGWCLRSSHHQSGHHSAITPVVISEKPLVVGASLRGDEGASV